MTEEKTTCRECAIFALVTSTLLTWPPFLFPKSHLMPKQIYTSLSPDFCPLPPTRAHHHHPQSDRRCHPTHPARSNRYLMQGSQPLPTLTPSPLRCSACLRSCTPWAHTRKKCGTCKRLASAVLCRVFCEGPRTDWKRRREQEPGWLLELGRELELERCAGSVTATINSCI